MEIEPSRRDVFKVATAVAFTALQLPAYEPNGPLFFDKTEFRMLDTLTELIIPTDDHSPGAHAAGVASYIDWNVAHAVEPEAKSSWTKGLALINDLSRELFNATFLKCTPEQQNKVLSRLCGMTGKPTEEQNRFWGQLKDTTAFVYYSSSIGIHEDMNYKGNVILQEFVGYDAT
jgi:hypothetical protein